MVARIVLAVILIVKLVFTTAISKKRDHLKMVSFYSVLAASFFLSSVVLLNSQAFSAVPFNIVKPSNKIGEGRCYMDECSYSKL